jgi:O-antigen/teichoic acid export membrane protein
MTIKSIVDKYKHSDIARRMATGAFWSLAGSTVSKLLVLVAGILCAHILGKEDYGKFGMVKSTIGMFIVLGSFGLGITATKYIAEYRKSEKDHVCSIYFLTNGFAFIFAMVVSVLVFVFSDSLAENVLHAIELSTPIKISSLILLFTILNTAQDATLAGFESFKSIALSNFVCSVLESVGMVLLAYCYGIIGAVIGYGSGFIVKTIVNKLLINRDFKNNGISIKLSHFRKSDFRLLYTYTLPAALSTLLAGPTFWVLRAMLARNAGYGELAIYDVADQWKLILLFIPGTVSQIILPIMSSLKQDEKSRFWKVLHTNILLNVCITAVMSVVIFMLSNYIMNLYGKGFNDSLPLIILSFSTIFTSISTVLGISISSLAKMWTWFAMSVIWAAATIVMAYVFISMGYQATGVAMGVLIGYIINSIIQYIYLRKTHTVLN